MDARARGPLEYPLGNLTPQQFETLTFLLARAEDPAVVPVRNKDRGLDARLPDGRGRTLRGWQAKRFAAGEIHWDQCRTSVRNALAFWRPPYITFTFPHDLSAAEQTAFSEELATHFSIVRLDFWSGSEVQRRIRDTEEGRRAAHWLFENSDADQEQLRRALATGGELASTMQAVERQAVIQRFVDRDPHVHYTMVSRSGGGPYTPPAPETFLSVVIDIGGAEIRLDASERYSGALSDLGGPPSVYFSADEAGREAARAVQLAAEGGEPVTISSGIGVAVPAVPVGLQGLMSEDLLEEPAEVRLELGLPTPDVPTERGPQGLPVLLSADGSELGMTLVETAEPVEGFEVTVAGAAGAIEIFQSLARAEETGTAESRLDWRHTLGHGTALEQLLAARITRAALRGGTVQLLDPHDRRALASGQGAVGDTGDPDSLDQSIRFLELVAEAEAWLGAPLDPPARPSERDASELGRLIGLIRQPERQGTWERMVVTTADPDRDIEAEPVQVAVLQPIHAELFGQQIYAGIDLIALHSAVVERREQEAIMRPADKTAALTATLQHPSLAPADAARAPSGVSGGRVLIRPLGEAQDEP